MWFCVVNAKQLVSQYNKWPLLTLLTDFVQAILKIIKHCKEFMPALVTGQLLGLDVGSVLEVTNCFPFPVCSALFSSEDTNGSHSNPRN